MFTIAEAQNGRKGFSNSLDNELRERDERKGPLMGLCSERQPETAFNWLVGMVDYVVCAIWSIYQNRWAYTLYSWTSYYGGST
jgi:hypothetical protein